MFLKFLLVFTFAQQNNYINYFQLCNEAEVSICKEDIETAVRCYQDAFQTVNYPLVKDLYNATICTAISKQDSLMFVCLELCLKRGVLLSVFEDNFLAFGVFLEDVRWHNLKSKQKIFQEEYKTSINLACKNTLQKMDELDQQARNSLKGYAFFSKKKKVKVIENIQKTDSLISLQIDSLILLYGYPSEKQLGIGKGLGKRNPIVFFHRTDSLFVYHTEYTALQHGCITPFYYSAKVDYARTKEQSPYYWNMYYMTDLPSEKIDEVDNRRRAIGMPTIKEEEVMRQYFYKTKNMYKFQMAVYFRK